MPDLIQVGSNVDVPGGRLFQKLRVIAPVISSVFPYRPLPVVIESNQEGLAGFNDSCFADFSVHFQQAFAVP